MQSKSNCEWVYVTDSTTHSGSARTTDAKPMHTPGPWEVEFGVLGGFYIEHATRGSSGGTLVICSRQPIERIAEESNANARLIAAAPDMFAALQTIAELPMPEQDNMVAANMRAIALAALSRTTGDSA